MGLNRVQTHFRCNKIEDLHFEQPKVCIERDWAVPEYG